MEFILMTIIALFRYILIHTILPTIVDYLLFDPIKDWVKEQFGNGGREGGPDGSESETTP